MTSEEIKNGICSFQTRFEQILFNQPGDYQDGIPNLSDLYLINKGNTSQTWSSIVSYIIGDVISWNNIIYISLSNNSSKQPDLNPSDFKKIEVKGLSSGEFFTNAYFVLETDYIYASDFSNLTFRSEDSLNIKSVQDLGDGYVRVNISESASIVGSDYIVLFSGTGKKNQSNEIKNDSIIITYKNPTSFIFKIPYIAGTEYMSFLIISEN